MYIILSPIFLLFRTKNLGLKTKSIHFDTNCDSYDIYHNKNQTVKVKNKNKNKKSKAKVHSQKNWMIQLKCELQKTMTTFLWKYKKFGNQENLASYWNVIVWKELLKNFHKKFYVIPHYKWMKCVFLFNYY